MPEYTLAYTGPEVDEALRSELSDVQASIVALRGSTPIENGILVPGVGTYAWLSGSINLSGVKLTGTNTAGLAGELTDSSAAFSSESVAVGDIVNNTTDGTSTTVSLVQSETRLVLNDDIFAATGKSYEIGHAERGLYLSSTLETYGPGEANDGRWVAQYEGTPPISFWGVAGSGDEGALLQNALDDASSLFFPEGTYTTNQQLVLSDVRDTALYGPGTIQAGAAITSIFKKNGDYIRSPVKTGTNDSVSSSKLVDSAALFQTLSIVAGYLVNNLTDGTTAEVVSVDSQTQITLDADIFTATGKRYRIGPSDVASPAFKMYDMTVDANGNADHCVYIERSRKNLWSGCSLKNFLVSGVRMQTTNGTASGSHDGYYTSCEIDGGAISSGTITSTADNGSGAIRVTSAAHGLSTGQYVNVGGFATDTGGRYQVTVITAGTFDLDGSTWTTNETGTWARRPDIGIDINTLSRRNLFSEVVITNCGLYGADVKESQSIFSSCRFRYAANGIRAAASVSISNPFFDTVEAGVLLAANDVMVAGGIFYRNTADDNDPNTMKALMLESSHSRFTLAGSAILPGVTQDIDLNGQTLTDYMWNPSSGATTGQGVIPWNTATAPDFVEIKEGVDLIEGVDIRFRLRQTDDAASNYEEWAYDDGGTPTRVRRIVRLTPDIEHEVTNKFLAPVQIGDDTVLTPSSTFANLDATPDVSGSTLWVTANSSSTTITNFDGGTANQLIYVHINDVNTTIQNNVNIITKSGSDLTVKGVFAFLRVSAEWREI